MKKCLVLLLLAASLAACTPLGDFFGGAGDTDTAATDTAATAVAAAAVAATQTAAAPTSTFTPTPTSTATATPSATPGPTPFPLPEGWIDYGGEGFYVALPESWNVVDVDRQGIDVVLETLENVGTEWAESVAASVSAEQIQEALKLWAMDSEAAGMGFATLDLQHQELPIVLSVSMFLDQVQSMYEGLEIEVVSVEPGMEVNGLEAGRICVRMSRALRKACQYVFVEGRDLWTVTAQVDEEAWAEYESIFTQIADTFRLQ